MGSEGRVPQGQESEDQGLGVGPGSPCLRDRKSTGLPAGEERVGLMRPGSGKVAHKF